MLTLINIYVNDSSKKICYFVLNKDVYITKFIDFYVVYLKTYPPINCISTRNSYISQHIYYSWSIS